MKNRAMLHVLTAVRRGLAPSRCPEHEARALWRGLEDVERYRLARFLSLEDEDSFAVACVQEAVRERARRANESGRYLGRSSFAC